MNLHEKARTAAEEMMRRHGVDNAIRTVRRSMEANRSDHIEFIKVGRPHDAHRAENAMFLDGEVLRILREERKSREGER